MSRLEPSSFRVLWRTAASGKPWQPELLNGVELASSDVPKQCLHLGSILASFYEFLEMLWNSL